MDFSSFSRSSECSEVEELLVRNSFDIAVTTEKVLIRTWSVFSLVNVGFLLAIGISGLVIGSDGGTHWYVRFARVRPCVSHVTVCAPVRDPICQT